MKHRHRDVPVPSLGLNPDGSARVWRCEDCRREIPFDPSVPIDPAAAHLIADIRGDGLRSVR